MRSFFKVEFILFIVKFFKFIFKKKINIELLFVVFLVEDSYRI